MTLHRALADLLRAAREAGRPPFSACSPHQARDLLARSCAVLGAGPQVGSIRDLAVPTRGSMIRARLFEPTELPAALIVYVHGGGWVLGTVDDYDALARALVARTACSVLLLDYRLAPEHPFPAGLEDVEDGIAWASAHRRELVGSECRLVVAGDSAGANLATVALAGRTAGDIALQILFYPVVDCDTATPSYDLPVDTLFLTRADMLWFFRHYAPPDLWSNPRISPLRAECLAGLPPTWIATAEYDVLRDEAEAYARRLMAHGVTVRLRRFDGMGHGFARMMNVVEDAHSAFDDVARLIAERCAA
ncbi:alpha/beta hydrolase [Methylobacterium oryzisoli]|uniref:alpha/beta hydrolase n=1 Tax=Methylobacterium oryzisoli TaxID=3385502 RepID=UPI003891F2AE